MAALPSIIMGLNLNASPEADGPTSDGIFGQLLLLGVGRMIAPFVLAAKLVRHLWQ